MFEVVFVDERPRVYSRIIVQRLIGYSWPAQYGGDTPLENVVLALNGLW